MATRSAGRSGTTRACSIYAPIWVKQYDPGTDAMPLGGGRPSLGGLWMVLGADGQIAAHIQMPPDFAPLLVVGDKVLGLTRDDFDVESLVLFELQR